MLGHLDRLVMTSVPPGGMSRVPPDLLFLSAARELLPMLPPLCVDMSPRGACKTWVVLRHGSIDCPLLYKRRASFAIVIRLVSWVVSCSGFKRVTCGDGSQ